MILERERERETETETEREQAMAGLQVRRLRENPSKCKFYRKRCKYLQKKV